MKNKKKQLAIAMGSWRRERKNVCSNSLQECLGKQPIPRITNGLGILRSDGGRATDPQNSLINKRRVLVQNICQCIHLHMKIDKRIQIRLVISF